jgi:hypothetical protein
MERLPLQPLDLHCGCVFDAAQHLPSKPQSIHPVGLPACGNRVAVTVEAPGQTSAKD